MTQPEVKHEVIDVDDLDIFCTGVRHCIRIERPPSPRQRKRARDPVTISLVDSEDEDKQHASASQFNPLRDSPCVSMAHLQQPAIHRAHSSPIPPVDHCTELQRITQAELLSRTAHRDARSPRKRAVGAIRMATDVVKNLNKLKREDREVIEISSDSEPELWPSKRQRVEHQMDVDSPNFPKFKVKTPSAEPHFPGPSDWSSDDDDCVDFLASLDVSNEANWVPQPEGNKAEDFTPVNDLANDPSKSQPFPAFHVPRKKPPIDHHRVPFNWDIVSSWGTILKNPGITKFPRPSFHARRQDRLFPVRSPSIFHERGFSKLELTAKYPHLMSGSINKIIQRQGIVVICAVVEGGLAESDDEAEDQPLPPPENRSGSLVVYHHGRVHVQPAHCHARMTSHGSAMKYYSVNDIAFNPFNPQQFLSSGNDLVVRMWQMFDDGDNGGRVDMGAIRCIPFDSKPQDLVYAPDGLALAVTCYDGTVRLYTQDLFEDMIDMHVPSKRFRAAPRGSDHAAGCTLWGKGPSGHLLFSSSEPTEKDDHSGFHHAFDTCKGTLAFQFDAPEAGDAATLSPNGETLVLFTSGKDGEHPVRLYDVRRKCKDPWQTTELEKFRPRSTIGPGEQDDSGEVNQASFSPDGLLLAVARNDNGLHVYDMRAVSRGPLCRFEHHDSDAVGGGGFGIVAVNWIQGRDRIGIGSGGNDGCVRLWEPALGVTNEVQGMVIGRSDFDVGHFSIGNPQNGEVPLIIGDSGGGVHTYDFTNSDGTRI